MHWLTAVSLPGCVSPFENPFAAYVARVRDLAKDFYKQRSTCGKSNENTLVQVKNVIPVSG